MCGPWLSSTCCWSPPCCVWRGIMLAALPPLLLRLLLGVLMSVALQVLQRKVLAVL